MRYLITDNKKQFKNRSAVEVGKYLRVFQTLILNKCQ